MLIGTHIYRFEEFNPCEIICFKIQNIMKSRQKQNLSFDYSVESL